MVIGFQRHSIGSRIISVKLCHQFLNLGGLIKLDYILFLRDINSKKNGSRPHVFDVETLREFCFENVGVVTEHGNVIHVYIKPRETLPENARFGFTLVKACLH